MHRSAIFKSVTNTIKVFPACRQLAWLDARGRAVYAFAGDIARWIRPMPILVLFPIGNKPGRTPNVPKPLEIRIHFPPP